MGVGITNIGGGNSLNTGTGTSGVIINTDPSVTIPINAITLGNLLDDISVASKPSILDNQNFSYTFPDGYDRFRVFIKYKATISKDLTTTTNGTFNFKKDNQYDCICFSPFIYRTGTQATYECTPKKFHITFNSTDYYSKSEYILKAVYIPIGYNYWDSFLSDTYKFINNTNTGYKDNSAVGLSPLNFLSYNEFNTGYVRTISSSCHLVIPISYYNTGIDSNASLGPDENIIIDKFSYMFITTSDLFDDLNNSISLIVNNNDEALTNSNIKELRNIMGARICYKSNDFNSASFIKSIEGAIIGLEFN